MTYFPLVVHMLLLILARVPIILANGEISNLLLTAHLSVRNILLMLGRTPGKLYLTI